MRTQAEDAVEVHPDFVGEVLGQVQPSNTGHSYITCVYASVVRLPEMVLWTGSHLRGSRLAFIGHTERKTRLDDSVTGSGH